MQAAFKFVMYDQNYVDARLKRYRIFMFCYMFGCIHANDLHYVFFKELYGLDSRKHSENVNAWNALLTYLCKQGYLRRMEKGYCHLKKEGIESLYEHLCCCHIIDNVDFQTFRKNCRIRQNTFASHSAKAGRAVLSFVQSPESSFIVEPFLGLGGKMIKINERNKNEFVFIPDALVCDELNQEAYFIEADSCKESLPSQLMPKFSSYADFMDSQGVHPDSCTILFSAWNDVEKDVVLFDFYEYADFMSMYDFIDMIGTEPLSFTGYMDALRIYAGNNECLLRLSAFLNERDFSKVSCKKDFLDAFKNSRVRSAYTSKYLLRRKHAQSCVSNIKSFRKKLLEGSRFVCLPLNTFYHLYDYIFFERESAFTLCQKLILKYFPEYQFVGYEKSASFEDERSGEYFVFRNVFILEKDLHEIRVCVENISDDLSGISRMKKYINFQRKIVLKDTYFVCLYNDYFESEEPDLLGYRIDLLPYISVVPYSRYSPL